MLAVSAEQPDVGKGLIDGYGQSASQAVVIKAAPRESAQAFRDIYAFNANLSRLAGIAIRRLPFKPRPSLGNS